MEQQLARILASREFRQSGRMSRFLRFVVEQFLAGEGDAMKESLIGLAVFDRTPGYDPRIDPIVRVEARRLRAKLESYYAGAGATDPMVVELPKGSYVPVLRLAGEFRAATAPVQPAPLPRILVLPLANLDAPGESDYFSDGLTQELIHALTRVPGLQVVAWSSAARLRGMSGEEPVRQVEASAALEGSVRRAAGRVRISVQLVDAASSVYLWSGVYERALDDLFAIQQEIAQSIAAALRVKLTAGETAKAYNTAAYDFYLRGRYEWNRRTPQSLRQSTVLFEQALRVDPLCAPAWAGLADSYSLHTDYGMASTADVMPKAHQAAQRALELDPTLADAHVSLAFIVGLHYWRWEEAGAHYRRALELNPGYVTAHHWYGLDHLALLGRQEEAAHHLEIARQLDPLEPIIAEGCGYLALLARRFDEAIEEYERLTHEHPHFPKGWTGLGRTAYCQQRYDAAIEFLERGRALSGDLPSILGALSQTHGAAGNIAEARRLLNMLIEMSTRQHVPATSFAVAHLGLQEQEEALDALDASYEARETSLPVINVHPIYDPLRGHPRFVALLQRMNL